MTRSATPSPTLTIAAPSNARTSEELLGMTYYDVFATLCVSDSSLAFVCGRVDGGNAALVDTYDAARVPVADVAGAFENYDLPAAAAHVCDWTCFCVSGDTHPNVLGYGVIARAYEAAIPWGRSHSSRSSSSWRMDGRTHRQEGSPPAEGISVGDGNRRRERCGRQCCYCCS